MHSRSPGLAAVLAVALLGATAAPALAAPVTVTLRIEGPTSTLYEGPVSTDVRPFAFTSGTDTAPHVCNGTAPAGSSTTPVVSRGAVVAASGVATTGTFSTQFGSPTFDTVAGVGVGFDAATNAFLAEYKNGVSSQTGSCGEPVADGDQVLYAYGTGSEALLTLGEPQPGSFLVTDAAGAPVAGATVGGATTGADGRVALAVAAGTSLKATKAGAIRSNAIVVGATSSVQGVGTPATPGAGTPDRVAPVARVGGGLRDGRVFAHGRGPRTLTATAGADATTVKLRLSRRSGSHCAAWSGKQERFIGVHCGRAFPFAVDAATNVSYLLPQRLGGGRYRLEVVAVDKAGNRTTARAGTTLTRFRVR